MWIDSLISCDRSIEEMPCIKEITVITVISLMMEVNLSTNQDYLMPWVELADSIGVPRSIGQLYGVLFMAGRSMSAQECADDLKISRSSAGQGLKVLKEYGAIKSVFELGDRSERYAIEQDLGILIQSVLRGKLAPAFGAFFSKMNAIGDSIEGSESSDVLLSRIRKLERWQGKFFDAQKWLMR
jgi:DNA-binding transcriptional regulator GbsR (MarR family)